MVILSFGNSELTANATSTFIHCVSCVAVRYYWLCWFTLQVSVLLCPTSIEGGITKWCAVSLSVRPFVCRVPRPNSRTERSRKKISRLEAHNTDNPWTYLEVKRSKIKVTRPINAVTDNAASARPREFPWCKGESESIIASLFTFTVFNSCFKFYMNEYEYHKNGLIDWLIDLFIIIVLINNNKKVSGLLSQV